MALQTPDPGNEAAGGALTAKQAPHRPGTAPTPGLRVEMDRRYCTAGQSRMGEPTVKRTSCLDGRNPAPARRRGARRTPAGRKLFVEALDDRNLPSFLGPVNYAGTYPYDVATGHFNGDTVLDLAVLN